MRKTLSHGKSRSVSDCGFALLKTVVTVFIFSLLVLSFDTYMLSLSVLLEKQEKALDERISRSAEEAEVLYESF